jgi:glycosyltransferase involved in cell wall biosynthesis
VILGFSIIICTYNGRNRLPETLKYIQELSIPDGFFIELIVVDNRSNDGTSDFVEKFFCDYSGKVKLIVLQESRPGKAYALETALNSMSYCFGLICDDGNWLNSDYLTKSSIIFSKFPEVGIISGKSIGKFENLKPSWFDILEKQFAVGVQCKKNGIVDYNIDFLWGAGCVFRKDIITKLRMVNYSFVTGKNVNKAVGEDIELAMLAKYLGYKFFFDSSIFLYHYMPEERMNWQYVKLMYKGFGLTFPYFTILKRIIRNNNSLSIFEIEKEIFKRLILVFLQISKMILFSLLGKNKFIVNRVGNIENLKFIEKVNYFLTLSKVFKFRKDIYYLNSKLRLLNKNLHL